MTHFDNAVTQDEERILDLPKMFTHKQVLWTELLSAGLVEAQRKINALSESSAEVVSVPVEPETYGFLTVNIEASLFGPVEVHGVNPERVYCYAITSVDYVAGSAWEATATLIESPVLVEREGEDPIEVIPANLAFPLAADTLFGQTYRYGNLVTHPTQMLAPFVVCFKDTMGVIDVTYNLRGASISEDGRIVPPEAYLTANKDVNYIELVLFNRVLGHCVCFASDVLSPLQLENLDRFRTLILEVFRNDDLYSVHELTIHSKAVTLNTMSYHNVDGELLAFDDDVIDETEELNMDNIEIGDDIDADDYTPPSLENDVSLSEVPMPAELAAALDKHVPITQEQAERGLAFIKEQVSNGTLHQNDIDDDLPI